MTNSDIDQVISLLKEGANRWNAPAVTKLAESTKDPFKVLISTILSSRTKDETTAKATERLFGLAHTPEDFLRINDEDIRKAIYPVGFYRNKAKIILRVCKDLVEKHNSQVPDEIEELLKLKGVGRKTANLVVTLGFNKLGICVDTHVHRISNRLGYISTKTPEETEKALKDKLPMKYWLIYNDLMVTHGQNICKPISPLCSQCKIEKYCQKVGVTKHR